MTFVLSFPRDAINHLACRLRQTGLQNLYTPYLYIIGPMQVNTLDHVYGRCILTLAQSDEQLHLIIRRSGSGAVSHPREYLALLSSIVLQLHAFVFDFPLLHLQVHS